MKKALVLSIVATLVGSSLALAQPTEERPAKHEARSARHFAKLDQNGDGKVTKAELVAAHEKRFDAMDQNRDGKVTQEERKAAKEARRAEMLAKHPEWADKAGKGKRGHFGKRGDCGHHDAEVTRADVRERAEQRFAKLDENGDGALTRDELAAAPWHGRGRGHGHGHGGRGPAQTL
jgi:hypothetical protein